MLDFNVFARNVKFIIGLEACFVLLFVDFHQMLCFPTLGFTGSITSYDFDVLMCNHNCWNTMNMNINKISILKNTLVHSVCRGRFQFNP